MLTFEERSLPSGGDILEVMKTLEATTETDWRVFRHGTPTLESKKFNEESEEEQCDAVDPEKDTRKCAMNLDEFRIETCVDCNNEVDSKDVWWYRGCAYCEECYHSYLAVDKYSIEAYQVNAISGGGSGDDLGSRGLGRDGDQVSQSQPCLLYTSPSPRDS